MKKSLYILSAAVLTLGISGCETISESDCMAGAWAEYGYQDGLNGLAILLNLNTCDLIGAYQICDEITKCKCQLIHFNYH